MINPMVDRDGNISMVGFDDYRKGVMQGFAYAVEALRTMRYDYPDDESKKLRKRLRNEFARDIIDKCIKRIDADGTQLAIAYQDECYDENAPAAKGDMTASEFLWKRGEPDADSNTDV